MCLALPARVVELRRRRRRVIDLGGVRKTVSVALVPEARGRRLRHRARRPRHRHARPGEAERTLALFAEMAGRQPQPERRMKYVDEFRDGDVARKIAERIAAEVRSRAQLPLHGVLRRPHARHLALRRADLLPPQRAHDPRPRLPGLRAADRPHRPGHPPGAGTRRDRRTYGDTMRVPASAASCR
jgi:hydrogenase expression/formation protein HypC